MAKYTPLDDFLLIVEPYTLRKVITFGQVEQIIGSTLKSSAYKRRQWWENSLPPHSSSQAKSWLSAGWRVETVNFNEQWVCFERQEQHLS